MTTIGNVPAGLLSLLRAQNFGENPRELSSVVASVVDVKDQYIFNNIEHGFALFTPALGVVQQDVPTLSGEISVTVPVGELWWIEDCSLRLNPAVGISYRGQVVIIEPPAQYLAMSEMIAGAASTHQFVPSKGRFWMEPGTKLAANYDTIVGAPTVGSSLMTLRYARFRV